MTGIRSQESVIRDDLETRWRTRIVVSPLTDQDLRSLALQPSQAHLTPLLRDPATRADYLVPELSYAVREAGRLAACAGVMPLAPHRGFGWALVGALSARGWVGFTGATRSVLQAAEGRGIRRIETIVDADFPPGIVWVKALGFEVEGYMPGYWPDGRAALLYGRLA